MNRYFRSTPPVVLNLIIINCLMLLATQLLPAGDKIDFTRVGAAAGHIIDGNDPVAFQTKQQARQKFCPMPFGVSLHF